MSDKYDTFVLFCAQSTRMYTELSAALNAAFYESAITGFKPVDIWAAASDGSISADAVATVTAGKAA